MEIRGFHFGFCSSGDSGFSLLLLRFIRVPFWVILGFSSFKGDVFFNKQKQQEIFSKAVVAAEYGTERERGSGLGIVISKELIEKQKGKLSVESEEGKGSSFTLSFPLS